MRDGATFMRYHCFLALGLVVSALAWAGPALAASERCVAFSNGSGKAAWVGIRNAKCASEASGFNNLCAYGGMDDGASASFCPRAELGLGDRFGVVFIQDGHIIECEDLLLTGHAHLAAGGVCKMR